MSARFCITQKPGNDSDLHFLKVAVCVLRSRVTVLDFLRLGKSLKSIAY